MERLGKYKVYLGGFIVGLAMIPSGATPAEQTIGAFLAMIFIRLGEMLNELKYQ